MEYSYERKGLENFFRNRILRLFFPLLIVRIISGIYNNDLSFFSTIQRLTYKAPWFVRYIFVSYIIFWICKKLQSKGTIPIKQEKYLFISMFGLWFLLQSLFFYDPSAPSLQARQMLSFPFGVWLAKNREKSEKFLEIYNKRIIILGTIGFASTLFLEVYFEKRVPILVGNIFSLGTVFPLSLAMFALIYSWFNKIGNKLCEIIGRYSYELFLIHISFLSVIKNRSILGLVMFFLITLFLTIVVHKVSNFMNYEVKKIWK